MSSDDHDLGGSSRPRQGIVTAFASLNSDFLSVLPSLLWACAHLLGTCDIDARANPATGDSKVSSAADKAQAQAIECIPLQQATTSEPGPMFESLPASRTGIDLVYSFPTNAAFELLQDQGCASGVAIGDYDGDGNADVFLTHYNIGCRLYRNRGNWQFENVTRKAGVESAGRWCSGTTFVDIDNDGDLDLYVCVFNGPNLLYVNRGNGTFQERASSFGLDFSGASVMMAFADYDRDGRLDGYLVTHRLNVGTDHRLPANSQAAFRRSIVRSTGPGQIAVDPAYQDLFAIIGKGQGRIELIIAGQSDYLYHQEADGRFIVVNAKAGITGHDIGLAVTWWDFDDDGYPDLYVSNDYKGPDRLYRNNRDGTFTDVARTALPHVPWSSMGADTADLNNDGRLDLMATEMAGSTHFRQRMISADSAKERWFLTTSEPRQYPRNALYLSTGTERVLEAACLAGLEATDWTWSPKLADLDNDGRVDVFIANGMSRDFVNADLLGRMRDRSSRNWLALPPLLEENLAFRNLGEMQFVSVGKTWGLGRVSASFGAAVADLDRDGDLDLIVSNFNEPVSVYRNNSVEGHRILVRLKGSHGNSWGIGAKVKVRTPSGIQARCLSLSSGILSANEPLAHFGLGAHGKIDELLVEWPGGERQVFSNLTADCLCTVTEPTKTNPTVLTSASEPPARWFATAQQIAQFRHRERGFDDFEREPLLPWKLSQLGPGLAIGDVDGDGDEDVYLGGAAGQPGTLGLNDGQGQLHPTAMACFVEDQAAKDLGALFFDSDGDGDLDLYVVSGGVEWDQSNPLLRDRLYLNDGRGKFARAPANVLPDLRDSGSVVVAADFDRDGDLDLFVGSRCVPGKYPSTPQSRLLRNDGGNFRDVTELLAVGLAETGLVTSAVFSDADGDGWVDLLVTHEWGPVKLYRNDHGRFVEQTFQAGLAALSGFWNGIAAVDLDGDGDMDYVVTNLGLNTPYRASQTRPMLGFVVRLGGQERFIEAYFEGTTLYPVRGRDTFLAFEPSWVERFPSYQSFASTSLSDLLGEDLLQQGRQLEARTLNTGILVNDGAARFTFRALPRLAQVAPSFGVVAADFDGDGHPDIFLAQNFFSPLPETGRMDGGLGQLVAGGPRGALGTVEPYVSGVIVPGDAKSAGVTDLNGDGRPDLIVGINDGEWLLFTNSTSSAQRLFCVRLRGKPGNPTAVGAFVKVRLTDGSVQSTEVQAGGGYLSQSSSRLYFGLGANGRVREILVRWPEGILTLTNVVSDQLSIVLSAIND